MFIEFKSNRDRYEVNVFEGKKKSKSSYRNIIDKDASKLAQVLIDLYLQGFPIEKAFVIFHTKVKKKDWLGL